MVINPSSVLWKKRRYPLRLPFIFFTLGEPQGNFYRHNHNDRALTIRKVGETVDKVMKGEKIDFGDKFRSPGHVALLRAATSLLNKRRGQTELSIELALKAGISPSMVVCEMLDDKTGKALTKEDAIKYSIEKNMPFIEGKDLQ